jgi:6-phosphogluconate dehydrogenase
MKLGFIGLGKMGGQMVTRLVAAGHNVVVTDLDTAAVAAAVAAGAEGAVDRAELVGKLGDPAIVWLMIPAQFVDTELEALLGLLPAGSIVIDGGNSDFRLTRQRAKLCQSRQIQLVDVGTSGGILGLEKGFSMMIGGDKAAVDTIEPIIEALAQPDGWHYFGESGSGHYIKMVHNAIEYGLMESYAEGYRMLKDGPYKQLDLAAAGAIWQHGSIIGSLLNDLAVQALRENPELDGIDGFVAESGEARWTLEAAAEANVAMPAVQAALDVRLASQTGQTNFATKLLAALRNKFGGHQINR